MTRLEAGIREARNRMDFVERQWAQQAKREDWKIVAQGSYFVGGPVFLVFEVPEKYRAYCPTSIAAQYYEQAFNPTEPSASC